MKSTLDVSPSPSPGRPTASSEQQNNHRHKTPLLAQCCCWLASLSIHCSVKYVLALVESLCLFHVANSWSLCANMMSSLKPEVHNVSLCCQSRTEPLLQAACTKKLGEDCICSSSDTQSDTLIAKLCSLPEAE